MTPAEILARLYNRSRPQGLGHFHATVGMMSVEEAQALLEERGENGERTRFDWLRGRPVKVDPCEEPLQTRLYDRDNGEGAAEDALTGPYLPQTGAAS